MARKIGPPLLPVRGCTGVDELFERLDYLLDYLDVQRVANTLLAHLYPIMLDPAIDGRVENISRTGGYMVLMSPDGEYTQFPVGLLHPDKAPKYMKFSLEKPRRLRRRLHLGEVSSFQSANESKERFPGAIATGRYRPRNPERRILISFSGLPSLADEALSLAIAVYFRLMTAGKARAIGAISANKYLEPLLKCMGV